MPGPSAVERLVVAVRADFRCELCGLVLGAYDGENVEWSRHREYSFHHRQPRGSGGTRDPLTNTPPRLLLLCGSATTPDGCHTTVETQRAMAYANGWLVRRPTDPASVPVELYVGRKFLTLSGTYEEASP